MLVFFEFYMKYGINRIIDIQILLTFSEYGHVFFFSNKITFTSKNPIVSLCNGN